MKRILTILFVLVNSVIFSQATLTDLNLVFDISESNSYSSPFVVKGTVLHSTSEYNGNDINVGDLVYFQDGTTTYSLPIVTIDSQSYSYVELQLLDISSTVSYVPTGRAALIRTSNPDLLPVPPDGIPSDLEAGILNDLRLKIQGGVTAAEEITDYTGGVIASPMVPPAVLPSSYTGKTWRNSMGVLYRSDGVAWTPIGGAAFDTLYTDATNQLLVLQGPNDSLSTSIIDIAPVQSITAGTGISVVPYPGGVFNIVNTGDLSNTNEIELPSQTGNNLKALYTNGTSPYWGTVASSIDTFGVYGPNLLVSLLNDGQPAKSISASSILSAANGVSGTSIAANQVAYGSGSNAITSNANFIYNGTNVSVGGVTTPSARLHVVGADNLSTGWTAQFHNSATNNALMIRNDGNIGIATNNPLRNLHIEGSVLLGGIVYDNKNNTLLSQSASTVNSNRDFTFGNSLYGRSMFNFKSFSLTTGTHPALGSYNFFVDAGTSTGTGTIDTRFITQSAALTGNRGGDFIISTGTGVGARNGMFITDGNVQFSAYPNTLNTSGNPVNVLSTSSTGVVESHPISEVISAAGGITGTLVSGRIPYTNGTSTLTTSANLTSDGTNVGIGTTVPTDVQLDVAGKIRSPELVVDGGTRERYLSSTTLGNGGVAGVTILDTKIPWTTNTYWAVELSYFTNTSNATNTVVGEIIVEGYIFSTTSSYAHGVISAGWDFTKGAVIRIAKNAAGNLCVLIGSETDPVSTFRFWLKEIRSPVIPTATATWSSSTNLVTDGYTNIAGTGDNLKGKTLPFHLNYPASTAIVNNVLQLGNSSGAGDAQVGIRYRVDGGVSGPTTEENGNSFVTYARRSGANRWYGVRYQSGADLLTIKDDGNIGIGTQSPVVPLHVVFPGTGTGGIGAMIIQRSGDNISAPPISFRKTRGSAASPTAVQAGDLLGGFDFQGMQTNNVSYSADYAFFGAQVSGTPSGTTIPSSIFFKVGSSASPYNSAFYIHHSGRSRFGSTNMLSVLPQPNAKLEVIGEGNNSTTWTAQFHNNATNNALMIRDDGNIGIGTASPLEKIHIIGKQRLTDPAEPSRWMLLDVPNNEIRSFSTSSHESRVRFVANGISFFANSETAPRWSITGNILTFNGINNNGLGGTYNSMSFTSNMWPVGNKAFSFKTFRNDGSAVDYEKFWIGIGENGDAALNPNGGKFGLGTATPSQTLHVQGTARITGSDGVATTMMGRDGDGDISVLGLGSGLSITSGVLNVTASGATNLAVTGTSSPLTLTSDTGTDVTFTAGTGVSLTGTSGNITINATEVDGSITNEIQNLSLSGQTLSISGGTSATLPVVGITAGTGITATPTAGNYTITNTGDTNAGDDLLTSTIFDGDIEGTWDALTLKTNVVGEDNIIDGSITAFKLATQAAANGQVLTYGGALVGWVPSSAVGDVAGPITNLQIGANAVGTTELNNGAVTMAKINQASATTGQVITWNGTAWIPTTPTTGSTYTAGTGIDITSNVITNTGDTDASNDITTVSTAGGDLSGTFSNLQIGAGTVGATELAATGVVAGTYTRASFYVNAAGQITSITNGGGITSLNGQTGGTQTFFASSTGTDFAISSSGNVHTFVLPTANATQTGKLTSSDWTTFSSKIGGSGTTDQLAIFTGSGTVGSSSALSYSGSTLTVAGDISPTGKLKAGTLGTSPTVIVGRNASNQLSTVGVGAGLDFTGGTLSASNFYTADGTLTGSRIVTTGNLNIAFDASTSVTNNANPIRVKGISTSGNTYYPLVFQNESNADKLSFKVGASEVSMLTTTENLKLGTGSQQWILNNVGSITMPALASNPTTANSSVWVNSTTNRLMVKTPDGNVKSIATLQDDLSGGNLQFSTSQSIGNTNFGNEITNTLTADITITLDGTLTEGREYKVFNSNDGTTWDTFWTVASGYTVKLKDVGNITSADGLLTMSPYRLFIITRYGNTIYVSY